MNITLNSNSDINCDSNSNSNSKNTTFNKTILGRQSTEFDNNKPASLTMLKALCHENIRTLGYDYFSYEGYYPIIDSRRELSCFPAEWSALTLSKAIAAHNPITVCSHKQTIPFYWSDMSRVLAKYQGEIEAVKSALETLHTAAKQLDIHDGICVPIHGAGSERAIFNVARRGRNSAKLSSNLHGLQLLALSLHEAVKKANEIDIEKRSRKDALSPRELECLDWIAAGKTAWETAKIVGIAESTVSFHIRNTIHKLNAANRTHAVAIAMSKSLIKSI